MKKEKLKGKESKYLRSRMGIRGSGTVNHFFTQVTGEQRNHVLSAHFGTTYTEILSSGAAPGIWL